MHKGCDSALGIHRSNNITRLDALKRGITSTNSTERIPLLRDSNGNLIAPGDIPLVKLASVFEPPCFNGFDFYKNFIVFFGGVNFYPVVFSCLNGGNVFELAGITVSFIYAILYCYVKKP